MNKLFKIVGLIAIVAVLGFFIAGCSNGSTNNDDNDGSGDGPVGGTTIPAKWVGTYEAMGDTATLRANGGVSWTGWTGIPDGSRTGATIVEGGTLSGDGYSGEWVYLAFNGVNEGFLFYSSKADPVTGDHYAIGVGYSGASQILTELSSAGITLSPPPVISGFPTLYWFSGTK